MNKFFKLFAIAVLAFIMLFTAVACDGLGGRPVGGDDDDSGADPNDKRPSMFISVFNGGYGRKWLDKIVNEYNQSHPENKYKIVVNANKDEFNSILNKLASGTFNNDMFITNLYAYKLIDNKYVEDISAIWDYDPDNNGSTLRQTMYSAETYAQAFGDGEGGLYALPINESLQGFVYDHDVFLKYGLLYNEDGDFTTSASDLSKGKDGIAGTYDDGHPQTEAQWLDMCEKAKNMLGYAITYSGKFQVYLNQLFYQVFAQVDGVEAFEMNYDFQGTYDFGDGPVTITHDNGYLLADMRGKAKALQFLDTYTAAKDTAKFTANKYTDPRSGALGYSHTDAQNDYLIDNADGASRRSAMLWEGDWWENEAKTTFNALAEEDSAYAFRTRNYKFMTLPLFDNQVAEGNVWNIADNMYICVKKQTDSEKKDICMDFLKFFFQDKYIQNYTVETGGLMPYDVALTAEQEAQLSPFAKNMREIYFDRTHNEFINVNLATNIYDERKSDAFPSFNMVPGDYVVNNILYYRSAATALQEMTDYFKKDWQSRLTAYQQYLNNKVK